MISVNVRTRVELQLIDVNVKIITSEKKIMRGELWS